MIEIKFRAWDEDCQRMVSESSTRGRYIGDLSETASDNNYILMQYTGLEDKNGKEIYEGDIVEFLYALGDLGEEKMRCPVTFYEPDAKFVPQDSEENLKGGHYIRHWSFCQEVEVIGNIYENPELLKGQPGENQT